MQIDSKLSGIIDRQYHYDNAGNLSKISDKRHGETNYQYDPIGRVLAANQANLNETFAFDPAHNLLDQNNGKIQNNQVTVFEDKRYAYDNHGNLVDKKIAKHTHIQLEWNAAHQLIKTSTCRNLCHDQPTTQHPEYGYDAFGRRIFKRDEFGETKFVWDSNRLLSETRGAHTKTYVYNGGSFVPLAQLDHYAKPEDTKPKADVYYFHTDHLGTPRELTDVRGEICWSASYKTWGNVLTEEWYQDQDEREAYGRSQALRFQGQYYDSETGLHYNRFRYYDPDIGRFVSQDPIGLQGGNNLYQYARNPSGWVDPLGLAGYTVSANTAGTDTLARGVHVNISGPGLPAKGGHIRLEPKIDPQTKQAIGITLVPADKATRDLTPLQWNKAQASAAEYVNNPKNYKKLIGQAQAGQSEFPNTTRSEEMKTVESVLNDHKSKGTRPCT